ncbi:hypothetical protein [Lysinibacillus sp. 38-6]|uniref:YxiG family protein n=1 Tax=Lysinibacillus sp. 38-6 TaxID=3385991 RepID=UPI003908AEC8
MARVHIIEEIQRLLFTEAEFGRVFDVQIDYLKETVRLDILSINNVGIEQSRVLFEQVLSLYMCQFDEIEGIRLNEFNDTDDALLSEISYHPYGFGKINANLKGIKEISSNTNFYFQLNNKDYFFIEANRLVINNKVFNNLLVP